jgi:hypothetical protein
VERPGQTCVTTTGYAARKLEPDGVHAGPDLERVVDEFAPRWVVRPFPVARQILRASDATDQAGFGAGGISLSKMRPPILYQEGSQHAQHCTKSSGSNSWLVSCDGPPGSPSTCRRRTGR